MAGFFSGFPRFFQTSETSPSPNRLNGRYEAIIAANAFRFRGKRVLDIASHDGRWSFAALDAGAAHVTGVEPREDLVQNAFETFKSYGVDPQKYDFKVGDIFEHIDGQSYDVVLCLGYFYHTIRHVELINKISATNAELVIIDTEVTPKREESLPELTVDSRWMKHNPYIVEILLDPCDLQQMAYRDATTRNDTAIVGRPSRAFMALIAEHFGYQWTTFEWATYLAQNPAQIAGLEDYRNGWRDTFTLLKR